MLLTEKSSISVATPLGNGLAILEEPGGPGQGHFKVVNKNPTLARMTECKKKEWEEQQSAVLGFGN